MLSCEIQYNVHTSKHSDQVVKVSSQVAPCVQIVQQDYCSDIPHRRLAMARNPPPTIRTWNLFSPLVILNPLLLLYQQRRCLCCLQGRSFNNERGVSRKQRALVSCHRYPGRDGPVSVSDTNQTHVNKHEVRSFYGVSGFIYLLDTSGLPLVSTASGNVPRALRTLTPGHRSGLKMSRRL